MSNAFTTKNTTWREALTDLVGRLSDADMARAAGGPGWTIGGLLGHMAFWDQRALVLLNRWKSSAIAASPIDVDVANDAMRPFLNAIPPGTVRKLATDMASAIDAAIDALSPESLAKVEMEGKPVRLDRGMHREHHMAQILKALA
jgi:hypothetical protein